MRQARVSAWRAMAFSALPLLYMAIIFYFSSQSGSSLHFTVSDKLLHTVEYGGLSFLLYLAFHYGLGWDVQRTAWLAVVVAVLYGISDEFHQSFVPGRDASVLDLVADLTGALLAQGGLWLLRYATRRWSVGA